MITLGNAARQLGLSKPTLSKAITRGQLSATRREDGSFAIDPAELMRWYESARHRFHRQPGANAGDRLQPSTGQDDGATGSASSADDLPIRFARIEAELAGMQQLIEAEKRRAEAAEKRADEIRAERDDWKHQATRLALAAPIAPPAAPKPEAARALGTRSRNGETSRTRQRPERGHRQPATLVALAAGGLTCRAASR